MNLVCPNLARQCRYGYRGVILSCIYFSQAFVHLFRQAKFVALNLFYLACLPLLHCRAKQKS